MRTFLLAGSPPAQKQTLVTGQQQWNTAGTFEWTCPADVYSINLAMIGAGGSSTNGANANPTSRWVGNGGNLRYKNNIPVVPGQKYSIVVPGPIQRNSNPALAFGISTNDPLSATLLGADGQVIPVNQSVPAAYGGCNAGGATANLSGNRGFNLLTFTQNNTQPPGYGTTTPHGFVAGGGAGIYNGGGQYPYFGATGAPGAVRIIWGPNRAFPATNIGNL